MDNRAGEKNVRPENVSSVGKGPQKTGGQRRSEGKGPCPHILASVLHCGRSVARRTPLPVTNWI